MLEIMRQLHLTVHNFCWAPKALLARSPHYWFYGGGGYAPSSAPFHGRPLARNSSPDLYLPYSDPFIPSPPPFP